jgi:hypothetical protein
LCFQLKSNSKITKSCSLLVITEECYQGFACACLHFSVSK